MGGETHLNCVLDNKGTVDNTTDERNIAFKLNSLMCFNDLKLHIKISVTVLYSLIKFYSFHIAISDCADMSLEIDINYMIFGYTI